MNTTAEPNETVQTFELRIHNVTGSLHLHYPITGTLSHAVHLADIMGHKHAENQTPGETVTVMLCSLIEGTPCAIWSRLYHDPATTRILIMNEKLKHAEQHHD